MKTPTFVIIACVIVLVAEGIHAIATNYTYTRDIENEWVLADRSSTIEAKTVHMDKFIAALEASGLQGEYNAVFLTKPENSFDANMEALKSLQVRLHEIAGMDPNSFQYNTALHQITEQEQGQASGMIDTFESIYWKEHATWLWGWIGVICVMLPIVVGFFAVVALEDYCNERSRHHHQGD